LTKRANAKGGAPWVEILNISENQMTKKIKRRKQDILLVEPPYKVSNLNLGLQKIATYHLKRGDRVDFIHDHPKHYFSMIQPKHYDKIYVTSVFTYHGKIVVNTIKYLQRIFPNTEILVGGIFATMMSDYVKKKTGIKPWIGIYPKAEFQKPDYTLFPKPHHGTVMTSRGCPRKCEFCAVKSLEPKFSIVKSWKKHIDAGYEVGLKNICIVDNNFTALPWKHQNEVGDYVNGYKDLWIFFASLDTRIFKERNAKLFNKLKISYIFWAFDNMEEDGPFQRAMELCHKYALAKNYHCYVLYNFEDTPQEFWYRLNEVIKSGATALPMKYVPLNALTKTEYVGKHWNKKMLKGFMNLLRRTTQTGASLSHNAYKHNAIGRSAEEFIDLITKDYVSTSYFSQLRQSDRALNTGFGLTDRKDVIQSKEKHKKRKKMKQLKKLQYRTADKVLPGQAKNK